MIQQKHEKEKDVGELFLVRLERNDLQKLGFDANTIESYEYTDVYLLWVDDNFTIKFVWHGKETKISMAKPDNVPKWIYHYIIDKYIES